MTAIATLTRRGGLTMALAALLAPSASASPSLEAAYGPGPLQRLDVHAAKGLGNAPVLVYVHGGGWSAGNKSAVNQLPGFAARNGFLLISVGYRLTPEVDAGGEAEDVAAALAWVKANAKKYGGNPDHIVLMGHSAGAHLVALVGVDPAYLGKHSLKPTDFAGVICLDGAAYDAREEFRFFDKAGGPVAPMFHAAFDKNPDGLSPTLIVKAASGVAYPPFLILYIASRPDSPPQARGLALAIHNAGGRVAVRSTTDATHREINQSFGRDGDPEGAIGAAFIKDGTLPPSTEN